MTRPQEQWYQRKPERYYTGVRMDMMARLPRRSESMRVLEIGCGAGTNGEHALAAGHATEWWGIELMAAQSTLAEPRLTGVITGDIESLELPWRAPYFDAIVASEVLEHLVDPWAVVRKLRLVLKPGGLFLSSSPNIANLKVVKELLHGRFEYRDVGVMDRTHLRWFTPKSYAHLFEEQGFAVREVTTVGQLHGKRRLASQLLPSRWHHLLWSQILVVAELDRADEKEYSTETDCPESI